jgi:nitroreductase
MNLAKSLRCKSAQAVFVCGTVIGRKRPREIGFSCLERWVTVHCGPMSAIGTDTLLSQLNWRCALKQFDPARKIDPTTWVALEEALVLAPSSFGLQPWRFCVIRDPRTKETLVPLFWSQRQLADASHVVVLAVKHPLKTKDVRRHIKRTARIRGASVEELAGFENAVNDFLENPPDSLDIKAWSSRQVYIALGSFMTSAALLGVDTCPLEGIEPAGYDRALGLEGSGYWTVAACPAGYRVVEDKYATLPKVRFEKKDIIKYLP